MDSTDTPFEDTAEQPSVDGAEPNTETCSPGDIHLMDSKPQPPHTPKSLHNSDTNPTPKNVPDVIFFSEKQGWIKSTKAYEIRGVGTVMQTTTQQRNPDGSYTISDDTVFIPIHPCNN